MRKTLLTTLLCLCLLTIGTGLAQNQGQGTGLWPDGLETISVSGTVIIDSNNYHPIYYLDIDGDATADYRISFGPWWYSPESGAARPEAGDNVTISGAMQEDGLTPPTLIVFEIDGLVWREANLYGRHGWHNDDLWNNQSDTLTVTGMVLIDTCYYYDSFFLDTDNDSIPEYKLGFGPHWYEPENGVTRPEAGEVVTIFGIMHENEGIDLLSVYEINDLVWRELSEPAPWAGTWVRKGGADSTRVHCVNDSSNWIGFPGGHMGQGSNMPDSAFVQFWCIHPDSIPHDASRKHLKAFYFNMHEPNGKSMMDGRFGDSKGSMRMQKKQQFKFHYSDEELQNRQLEENQLKLLYWDEETEQLITIEDADLNIVDNTVTFESDALSSYYVLSSVTITGVKSETGGLMPQTLTLKQNYPNPFNPSTTIEFSLPDQAQVKLTVYNLLGQRVAVLINENLNAGSHQVQWHGFNQFEQTVASGIYLLKLEVGTQVQVRQITLMK